MRDLDTYLAILEEREEKGRQEGLKEGREEGRIDEVKRLLVRLGQKSLGAPDEAVTATLQAITDLERLEALLDHLGEVRTWPDLLARL